MSTTTAALSARVARIEDMQAGPSALGVIIIPVGMHPEDRAAFIADRAAAHTGTGGLIVLPAKGLT